MFLVGMCDIFLILYLTSLSQVNPFHNSYLTVDDYNKLKEAKVQAEQDSQESHARILELKRNNSALDEQKGKALQSALSSKAETEEAIQLVKIEKEEVARSEIKLLKAINEIEKSNKLLQKSQDNEKKTLVIVKELQVESEKAKEREQIVLKEIDEIRKDVENAKEKESQALQIVKVTRIEAEKIKEDEQKALKIAEEARLKAEEAKKNEERALRLAEEAKLKEEEARKSEEIARKIAKKERLNAAKAKESETIALESAAIANNQKEIALENADMARKAEESALKVASIAQGETIKVKSEIKSIMQPSDNAYNKNIVDKLVPFTITIDYKDRLKRVVNKVIIIQGLPVKIGDDNVFFVPLDQIGLDPSSTHSNYITYNITFNAKPVTKLYIKAGAVKVAALVIDGEAKHCLPVDKTDNFSSYMPVLFSLRNQKLLGAMDRFRGVSNDYFIFKRDHLLMTTEDEFVFDSEGFRGTGNYAEYIVKGDQIVDLEGNFLGLAYKKNTILRINDLNGWHRISIQDMSAKQLANYIYNANKL